MRWRWQMLAIGLLLWLGAYLAIAYVECILGTTRWHPQYYAVLYTLRDVPFLLLLARAGDGDEGRAFRMIDSAQALLFSALVVILMFPNLVLGGQVAEITSETAISYHDFENIVLALLSLVGLIGQPNPERHRFARGVAALLVGYAVIAIPFNHLVIQIIQPPPGSPADMVGDIPFALLILVTAGQSVPSVERPRASRVSSLLQLLLPAAFSGASIAAALALVGRMPVIAVTGATAALLLKAMRSALIQFELGALQRFVAMVVDRLPDAVCVVEADGTVRLGNQAAGALFGVETRGRAMKTLVDRLEHAPIVDQTLELSDGRTLVMAEAQLAGGETIVRLTDVTRLRAIEREREEALQFLSHDMRSPNAAILVLLERQATMHAEAGLTPAALGRIRRYARHGLQMADDFVRLARARTASIADLPVEMGDSLAEAVDMVWPLAREKRISLTSLGEEVEAWTRGDRALLIRAIHNLLDNGIKYAPKGSTLTYRLFVTGTRIMIELANSGRPLSAERQRELFARFGAGHQGPGHDGIGLGLAFVRAAMLRHEGAITYHYESGRHIFRMELPLFVDE